MGNLALTFPELPAASFQPWVNDADAQARGDHRRGSSPRRRPPSWRDGLAAQGIGPERHPAAAGRRRLHDLHARLVGRRAAEHRRLAARAGALVGHRGGDAARRDRGHRDEPARPRRDRRRPALEPRAHPALEPDRERVARRAATSTWRRSSARCRRRRSASSACSSSTRSSRPRTAPRSRCGSTGCSRRPRSRPGARARRSTRRRCCSRRRASRAPRSSTSRTSPTRSGSS